MSELIERLRERDWGPNAADTLQRWDAARFEAADLIEALQNKVRNLTRLCDEHLGTPCEQIQHEHEVEALGDEITRLQALVEQLAGALGEAFETLTYVFECSDDDIASRSAKETADKIDGVLTAKGADQ